MTKIETLNAFRAAANLAPYASWKASRHQPMLDAYEAAKALADATAALAATSDTKAPAKKADKAPKAPTKKALALIQMQVAGGADLSIISHNLGITVTAARSLIGDLRREGNKIVAEKVNGATFYVAA